MQKEPSLYPDKGIPLERKRGTATSSEGSSFTQKESLQHPSEAFLLNTKDIKRSLVKKNRRGYLDTPFGTMPLNYSQEHPPRYPDYFSPSPIFFLMKQQNPKSTTDPNLDDTTYTVLTNVIVYK